MVCCITKPWRCGSRSAWRRSSRARATITPRKAMPRGCFSPTPGRIGRRIGRSFTRRRSARSVICSPAVTAAPLVTQRAGCRRSKGWTSGSPGGPACSEAVASWAFPNWDLLDRSGCRRIRFGRSFSPANRPTAEGFRERKFIGRGGGKVSDGGDKDPRLRNKVGDTGGNVLHIEMIDPALKASVAQHQPKRIFRIIELEFQSDRPAIRGRDYLGNLPQRLVELWNIDKEILLFARQTQEFGIEHGSRFVFRYAVNCEAQDHRRRQPNTPPGKTPGNDNGHERHQQGEVRQVQSGMPLLPF